MKPQTQQIAGHLEIAQAFEQFYACKTHADFRAFTGPHHADPAKAVAHALVALYMACHRGQAFIHAKCGAPARKGAARPALARSASASLPPVL